jgi:hypothetical protein
MTTSKAFVLSFVQPWVAASICGAAMFVCWHLSYRWNRRRADQRPPEGGSAFIDEACLAILGLLLAFTFAAAYSKYDNRNAKVAEDAGFLRTLYYRCDLLPEPWRRELVPASKQLIEERLTLIRPDFRPEDFPALDTEARATEARVLATVRRMSQDKDASSQSGPIADACFAVIASHETRISAAKDHVPAPVVGLLLLVASISAFLLGRSQAQIGRARKTTIILIVLVTAIIYVTMDLESPLRGLIQTDQTPILRLAETLGINP